MTKDTIRLQALAEITGRPREAIRNIQKSGDAPWNDADDFGDAGQRRYTGRHALALVIAEVLAAQGVSVTVIGETVRAHSLALDKFLDEIENSMPCTPRFVLAMSNAIEDPFTGINWEPVALYGAGTLDEVQSTILDGLKRVGQVQKSGNGDFEYRCVAGPSISLASIPEAYRLLRARAKAAGYVVDGRSIFKISDSEEAAE
ncbi:hypothetical protein [Rhodobacter maris]|uniref:HTH merR-type domain-containing protein n=1 Tax=Rhodobacter maris TaxID=446682 RepID=A0A285S4X0_9RHOB|nr:hypothetical protein [Rhodobacter maris]SOC02185.1 hypothetical protein SAMN05877831_10398 [Rhodobacter maris]